MWTKGRCRGSVSEAWTALGEQSVLSIPASHSLIHIPLPAFAPSYFSRRRDKVIADSADRPAHQALVALCFFLLSLPIPWSYRAAICPLVAPAPTPQRHVRMSNYLRHSGYCLVIRLYHWRNKRKPRLNLSLFKGKPILLTTIEESSFCFAIYPYVYRRRYAIAQPLY